MTFQFPATQLFDPAGNRRVVWSPEEHAAAIAAGCTHERPERHVPTIQEVLAAGYSPEAAEKIVARETEQAAPRTRRRKEMIQHVNDGE